MKSLVEVLIIFSQREQRKVSQAKQGNLLSPILEIENEQRAIAQGNFYCYNNQKECCFIFVKREATRTYLKFPLKDKRF